MQVYLVGGAVRDQLLGCSVTEHDYVVVGATPQQLLDQGFSQVGADFPVFLHPDTHDEYALARTERKSGSGYLGFSVYSAPDVTLEADLIRRDLTINAMALEVVGLFDSRIKTGHVIDPYGGLVDLNNRVLRHVSPAFCEDPVRVLRLARFASRYAPLGFTISDDTVALVQTMQESGELNHLVAERVWTETRKSLTQPWADVYFDSLYQIGVLATLMPELSSMMDEAKQSNHWDYIAQALRQAHDYQLDAVSKFGLLALAFIKGDAKRPQTQVFQHFCQRLKPPKLYQHVGGFMLENFASLQQFDTLAPHQLMQLFKVSSAFKDTQLLDQALACYHCFALAKQHVRFHAMLASLQPISAKDVDASLTGKAIGKAIEQRRVATLSDWLNLNNDPT